MSLNCTRCELCSAAADIFSLGSFVHHSLFFRLVTEPVAILGISLLTLAIYQTKALHFNARVLLICMTSSMLVANIGVLVETFYNIMISFVLPEDSRCEYQVFRPQYCLRIRSAYAAGGLGLAISTVFLAVERTLATVSYRTYEKVSHRWIGVLLCTIQVGVCVATLLSMNEPRILPYCSPDMVDSWATRLFGNILYASNIASLCAFAVLWLVNRGRTKSLVDSQLRVLSTRYQLKENISTTRLMVPVMLIVALMTTSSQIIYHLYLPNFTPQTVITPDSLAAVVRYAPFAEYQISLMPVLTFMMIMLLPMFSIHIKRSLYRLSRLDRCLSASSHGADTAVGDEARDLYFEKLQGQWHGNTHKPA